MMPREVVAIDIGNTTARVGLVDCMELRCLTRYECPISDASRRAAELAALAAGGRIVPIAVSSVVASLGPSSDLARNLQTMGQEMVWVGPHERLPLTLGYHDPQTLGADRIADLLYCHAVSGGRDAIVIDAGTAITVDLLLAGGEHAGGVIMPGVALQLRALHRGTSALPDVSLETSTEFPGRSTQACIAAGVREGIAGGLKHIVDAMQQRYNASAQIFSTGGGWQIISPRIDFECSWNPNLTLIGTALFCSYVL